MSTCQAGRIGDVANVGNWDNPRWADWYDPCAEPVTHRISSGCVHEHVITWDICSGCAARLERRDASGDPKQCVACLRIHGDCPVIVAIKVLEMAS